MFINLRISRRALSLVGIFLLLLVGIVAIKLVMVSNASVSKPIEQVKTDQKVISLTINVDWNEEYIPAILDALDKDKARVTFFVTGRWAKKHPELLKLMASRGHEIENHGYSHLHPDQHGGNVLIYAAKRNFKSQLSVIRAELKHNFTSGMKAGV